MNTHSLDKTGTSTTLGTILIVFITILLIAIVLAQLMQIPNFFDTSVPAIFNITTIRHENDYGAMTCDSRMVIKNTGHEPYPNRNLFAKVYRNDVLLHVRIATLNGHDYIAYAHTSGIQTMGGDGCSGDDWSEGEMTFIDFNDHTFRPGDIVKLEIFDNTTKQIISRHTYKA